ncbi:phosphate acetyltransferase [Modicisalibacter ilicicola DSM 19980]|uniref:Phosphate acetyltransferase n=1 Tax=Modicisalibacter ilicicola DSM 19980 TaxID=1121942 RepID=A0A1M4TJ22_9GAMM|nr:phosphate acetyltransferase [Halomonas ilicicola]SHE44471.1 phosphate acetyltransferase [Halomonas ilicicola DSM 19980]
MQVLDNILKNARRMRKRIVLSEGDDERVLEAAVRAAKDGLADIILVGDRGKIEATAAGKGLPLEDVALIDPAESPLAPALAEELHRLREKKGMTRELAEQEVLKPLVFADLMVRLGQADGSVAGAVHTTADVVRSAIQLVGVKPGTRLVSSFFLMVMEEPHHRRKGGMIFSDCGLVIDPSAEELAEIAMAAADNARALLDQEPKIAMLSFSTSGSAKHAAVDKVVTAARKVRAERPELAIDEDVQLDAAIVSEIARLKLPDSRVKGEANVLIFPDLEAGNIGYKLAERIGGATAIGPLLQGLAKPANDLSRGCSVDDVYHVIAVTAVQAQALEQRG